MRLVLLPGADGTGLLSDAFVAACGDVPVDVLAYPADEALGYPQLAQRLRARLPTAPFVLVGESFGGPLALMLADERPAGLRGLVLCASFARWPHAALRACAPLSRMLPARGVPVSALAWLLLGRWATPAWRTRLQAALGAVSADALRARVDAALRVDATMQLDALHVPLLYLRARADRLVPRAAGDDVHRRMPSAALIDVDAPHFLLQAQPRVCADAILRFAAALA